MADPKTIGFPGNLTPSMDAVKGNVAKNVFEDLKGSKYGKMLPDEYDVFSSGLENEEFAGSFYDVITQDQRIKEYLPEKDDFIELYKKKVPTEDSLPASKVSSEEPLAPKPEYTQEDVNRVARDAYTQQLMLDPRYLGMGALGMNAWHAALDVFDRQIPAAINIRTARKFRDGVVQANEELEKLSGMPDGEIITVSTGRPSYSMSRGGMQPTNTRRVSVKARKQELYDSVTKNREDFLVYLDKAKTAYEKETDAIVVQDFRQVKNVNDFIGFLGNGIGNAIGQMPLAILSGGTSSFLLESGMTYLEGIYEKARRSQETLGKPYTLEEIMLTGQDDAALADFMGAISASLDLLGAGTVGSNFVKQMGKKGAKEVVKRIMMHNATTEGGTETMQSLINQLSVSLQNGDSWEDAVKNLNAMDAFNEGLLGATGGVFFGTLSMGKPGVKSSLKQTVNESMGKQEVEVDVPKPETIKLTGGIKQPKPKVNITNVVREGVKGKDPKATVRVTKKDPANPEFNIKLDGDNKTLSMKVPKKGMDGRVTYNVTDADGVTSGNRQSLDKAIDEYRVAKQAVVKEEPKKAKPPETQPVKTPKEAPKKKTEAKPASKPASKPKEKPVKPYVPKPREKTKLVTKDKGQYEYRRGSNSVEIKQRDDKTGWEFRNPVDGEFLGESRTLTEAKADMEKYFDGLDEAREAREAQQAQVPEDIKKMARTTGKPKFSYKPPKGKKPESAKAVRKTKAVKVVETVAPKLEGLRTEISRREGVLNLPNNKKWKSKGAKGGIKRTAPANIKKMYAEIQELKAERDRLRETVTQGQNIEATLKQTDKRSKLKVERTYEEGGDQVTEYKMTSQKLDGYIIGVKEAGGQEVFYVSTDEYQSQGYETIEDAVMDVRRQMQGKERKITQTGKAVAIEEEELSKSQEKIAKQLGKQSEVVRVEFKEREGGTVNRKIKLFLEKKKGMKAAPIITLEVTPRGIIKDVAKLKKKYPAVYKSLTDKVTKEVIAEQTRNLSVAAQTDIKPQSKPIREGSFIPDVPIEQEINERVIGTERNRAVGKETISQEETEGANKLLGDAGKADGYFSDTLRRAIRKYIWIPVRAELKMAMDSLRRATFAVLPKPNENTRIVDIYRDWDTDKKYPVTQLQDATLVDENGKIIAKEYKNLDDIEELNSQEVDDRYMWRGISQAEYDFIMENGYIKSDASMNIGEGQQHSTSFAQYPSQAKSYAHGFAGWHDEVTFNEPKYVIRVNKEGVNTRINVAEEIETDDNIPASNISKVYEIRLATASPGTVEVVQGSDGNFRDGNRSPMYTEVVARVMPEEKTTSTKPTAKTTKPTAKTTKPTAKTTKPKTKGREVKGSDKNRDATEKPITTQEATPLDHAIPPAPIYTTKGKFGAKGPSNTLIREMLSKFQAGGRIFGKIIWTKNVNRRRRGSLGNYTPSSARIAVKHKQDMDVAAHEVGHALDDRYNILGPLLDTTNPMLKKARAELMKLAPHGSKPPKGLTKEKQLEYEYGEGIAEYFWGRIFNPEEQAALTPNLDAYVSSKLPKNVKDHLDAFSTTARTWMGMSASSRAKSNINTIFAKGFNQRMKDYWLNSPVFYFTSADNWNSNTAVGLTRRALVTAKTVLTKHFLNAAYPFEKAVDYARKLQGLKHLLPSKDPRVLARLLFGVHEKYDNMVEEGLVDSKNRRVIDKKTGDAITMDWLFEKIAGTTPEELSENMKDVEAFMVAQRIVERFWVDVRDAVAPFLAKWQHENHMSKNLNDAVIEKDEAGNYTITGISAIKETAKKIKKEQYTSILKKALTKASKEKSLRVQKSILQSALNEAHTLNQKREGQAKAAKTKAMKDAKKRFGDKVYGGIGGGLITDLDTSVEIVSDFELMEKSDPKKAEAIRESTRRYRVFADTLLRYAVDKGRLSQEQYNVIKNRNEFYVAMRRMKSVGVGDENVLDVYAKTGTGNIGSEVRPIHSFKGSGELIADPYVSLFENMYTIVKESDRNEVLRAFTDLLKTKRGMREGDVIDFSTIGVEVGEKNPRTVTVFEDGEAKYYQFDEHVAEYLKGINKDIFNIPMLLTALPKFLRMTVTTFPTFAVRNRIRDFQNRYIISKTKGTYTMEKPYALMNKDEKKRLRNMLQLYGGGQAGMLRNPSAYLGHENPYYSLMEEGIRKITKERGNKFAVTSFGDLKKVYLDKIDQAERATRVEEYNSAFNYAKDKLELDDYNAGIYAAYQARDMLDFSVAGSTVSWINQFVPFTNAAVQGIRKASKRAFIEKGSRHKFWANMVIYSVVPQLAIRMLIKQFGAEYEEEYKELPIWQKDMFYNIPIGGGKWLSIPKPFELGLPSSMVDRLITAIDTYDKTKDVAHSYNRAFEDFSKSSRRALIPFEMMSLAGSGARGIIEPMVNYDFFREKHIISPYEKSARLSMRNYDSASPLSKLFFGADKIKIDPRLIDHTVKSTASYYGDLTVRLAKIENLNDVYNLGLRLTGVIKDDPVFAAHNVQWVLKNAELSRIRQDKETGVDVQRLEDMLRRYHAKKSGPAKRKYGSMIRWYARYTRSLMESTDIIKRKEIEHKIKVLKRKIEDAKLEQDG